MEINLIKTKKKQLIFSFASCYNPPTLNHAIHFLDTTQSIYEVNGNKERVVSYCSTSNKDIKVCWRFILQNHIFLWRKILSPHLRDLQNFNFNSSRYANKTMLLTIQLYKDYQEADIQHSRSWSSYKLDEFISD